MTDRSARRNDTIDLVNLVFSLVDGENEAALDRLGKWEQDELFELLQRHGLAGLFYCLLQQVAIARPVPGSLLHRLREPYLEQWARGERLVWLLEELAERLAQAGRPFLVLKGPHLAMRFYGALDRRAMGDLDLLVRPEDLQATASELQGGGFRRRSPLWKEGSAREAYLYHVEFERDEQRVELHDKLRVHPRLRIASDLLWSLSIEAVIRRRRFRALCDEHCLLLQLLGMHTDVALDEITLRSFVDLHQILRGLGEEWAWDRFFAARQEEGSLEIAVNQLALHLALSGTDQRFPRLAKALAGHRDLLGFSPSREDAVRLLAEVSVWQKKAWAFRQYDAPLATTVSWWVQGLPHRLAGHGASVQKRLGPTRSEAPLWPLEPPPPGPSNAIGWSRFRLRDASLQAGLLRLGSWNARLAWSRAFYQQTVEELFRTEIAPNSPPGTELDASIRIFDSSQEIVERLGRPARSIVRHPLDGWLEIHHDIASAYLIDRGAGVPYEAWMPVLAAGESREHLIHCLMVVLYRLLYLLGRVHLHSAAVRFGGRTNLFVGEKGAGKSTLSLTLGLAGGEVLSEDHVVLRRSDGNYLVSGCDDAIRLTAKTERHFFEHALDVEPRDHAGILKKELRLGQIVRARPHVDHAVDAIFFPSVGERFALRPLQAQEAVLRLVRSVQDRHRFEDAEDRLEFLDFFGDLAAKVRLFDLTLSPDLDDLQGLVPFLSAPEESP